MSTLDPNANFFTLTLSVTRETIEAIDNFLFESGALGTEVKDKQIIATFPDRLNSKALVANLRQYCDGLNDLGFSIASDIQLEAVQNRDWNAEWKQRLKPMRVSRRLTIKPTWRKTPHNCQICVEMDPQMAFGTGSHPTTQMVLKFMDELIAGGETLADIGTGTGILAIAAVKLGARNVIACDIDPIAVRTARDNCVLNQAQDQVALFTGSVDSLARTDFDFILANISMPEITQMISELPTRLARNGRIVLSGLLKSEEKRIRQLLKNNHFIICRKKTKKEWFAVVAAITQEHPD